MHWLLYSILSIVAIVCANERSCSCSSVSGVVSKLIYPQALEYGESHLYEPRVIFFDLHNFDDFEIRIDSITSDSHQFYIVGNTQMTIAGSAAARIQSVFIPNGKGVQKGSFHVKSSGGKFSMKVSGTGLTNLFRVKPLDKIVAAGEPLEVNVAVYNPYGRQVTIDRVESSFGLPKMTAEPAVDCHDDRCTNLWTVEPKQTKLLLVAKFSPSAPGIYNGFLNVVSKKNADSAHIHVAIPMRITTKSGAEAVPSVLDYGVFTKRLQNRSRVITVQNYDRFPVTILACINLHSGSSVTVSTEYINTVLKPMQKAAVCRITLTTAGDSHESRLAGTVVVLTNTTHTYQFGATGRKGGHRMVEIVPRRCGLSAHLSSNEIPDHQIHNKDFQEYNMPRKDEAIRKPVGNEIHVPFSARISIGSLLFERTDTEFELDANKQSSEAPDPIHRTIHVVNMFGNPIEVTKVTIRDKRFTLENFQPGTLLQPDRHQPLCDLIFHPISVNHRFSTQLRVYTNISRMTIPVVVYNGALDLAPVMNLSDRAGALSRVGVRAGDTGTLNVDENVTNSPGDDNKSSSAAFYKFTLTRRSDGSGYQPRLGPQGLIVPKDSAPAEITLEMDDMFDARLEFGAVAIEHPTAFVVTVSNRNPIPVVISNITSSSEYLTAEFDQEGGNDDVLLMSGTSVNLKLSLLLPRIYHSDEEKSEYVVIDTKHQRMRIMVTFSVIKDSIIFLPDEVNFDGILPAEKATHKVLATSHFEADVEVLSMELEGDDLASFGVDLVADNLHNRKEHWLATLSFNAYAHLDGAFPPYDSLSLEPIPMDKPLLASHEDIQHMKLQAIKWKNLVGKQKTKTGCIAKVKVRTEYSESIYRFPISASVKYPTLFREPSHNFGLVSRMDSETVEVEVYNPSAVPVFVQPLDLEHVGSVKKIAFEFESEIDGDFAMLKPYETTVLGKVYFKPTNISDFHSILYLRNNLTRLDAFHLHGHGATSRLSLYPLGGKYCLSTRRHAPSIRDGLLVEHSGMEFRMDLDYEHIGLDVEDASTFKDFKPSDLEVRSSFAVKNRGDVSVVLSDFLLSNVQFAPESVDNALPDGCAGRAPSSDSIGFGFRVRGCVLLPIKLKPGESFEFQLIYQPDLKLEFINTSLVVKSSWGSYESPIKMSFPKPLLVVLQGMQPLSATEVWVRRGLVTVIAILFVFAARQYFLVARARGALSYEHFDFALFMARVPTCWRTLFRVLDLKRFMREMAAGENSPTTKRRSIAETAKSKSPSVTARGVGLGEASVQRRKNAKKNVKAAAKTVATPTKSKKKAARVGKRRTERNKSRYKDTPTPEAKQPELVQPPTPTPTPGYIAPPLTVTEHSFATQNSYKSMLNLAKKLSLATVQPIPLTPPGLQKIVTQPAARAVRRPRCTHVAMPPPMDQPVTRQQPVRKIHSSPGKQPLESVPVPTFLVECAEMKDGGDDSVAKVEVLDSTPETFTNPEVSESPRLISRKLSASERSTTAASERGTAAREAEGEFATSPRSPATHPALKQSPKQPHSAKYTNSSNYEFPQLSTRSVSVSPQLSSRKLSRAALKNLKKRQRAQFIRSPAAGSPPGLKPGLSPCSPPGLSVGSPPGLPPSPKVAKDLPSPMELPSPMQLVSPATEKKQAGSSEESSEKTPSRPSSPISTPAPEPRSQPSSDLSSDIAVVEIALKRPSPSPMPSPLPLSGPRLEHPQPVRAANKMRSNSAASPVSSNSSVDNVDGIDFPKLPQYATDRRRGSSSRERRITEMTRGPRHDRLRQRSISNTPPPDGTNPKQRSSSTALNHRRKLSVGEPERRPSSAGAKVKKPAEIQVPKKIHTRGGTAVAKAQPEPPAKTPLPYEARVTPPPYEPESEYTREEIQRFSLELGAERDDHRYGYPVAALRSDDEVDKKYVPGRGFGSGFSVAPIGSQRKSSAGADLFNETKSDGSAADVSRAGWPNRGSSIQEEFRKSLVTQTNDLPDLFSSVNTVDSFFSFLQQSENSPPSSPTPHKSRGPLQSSPPHPRGPRPARSPSSDRETEFFPAPSPSRRHDRNHHANHGTCCTTCDASPAYEPRAGSAYQPHAGHRGPQRNNAPPHQQRNHFQRQQSFTANHTHTHVHLYTHGQRDNGSSCSTCQQGRKCQGRYSTELEDYEMIHRRNMMGYRDDVEAEYYGSSISPSHSFDFPRRLPRRTSAMMSAVGVSPPVSLSRKFGVASPTSTSTSSAGKRSTSSTSSAGKMSAPVSPPESKTAASAAELLGFPKIKSTASELHGFPTANRLRPNVEEFVPPAQRAAELEEIEAKKNKNKSSTLSPTPESPRLPPAFVPTFQQNAYLEDRGVNGHFAAQSRQLNPSSPVFTSRKRMASSPKGHPAAPSPTGTTRRRRKKGKDTQ
eukprot:42131_1